MSSETPPKASRRRFLTGVVVALSLGSTVGVQAPLAELYRCTDAQGTVSYAGNPHDCRGRATRHETQRAIQSSGTPPVAPAAPQPRRARRLSSPGSLDEAAAATWKQKKHAAQSELAHVESQIPRWARLQTNCNRGADTWYTDEAGEKHTVSCSQIEAARSRAEAERNRLRTYLRDGLEEECRRAGCLPGWIR